jgi:hypothetical protein
MHDFYASLTGANRPKASRYWAALSQLTSASRAQLMSLNTVWFLWG